MTVSCGRRWGSRVGGVLPPGRGDELHGLNRPIPEHVTVENATIGVMHPVGGRLDGSTFWIVSEHGHRSDYVRNIAADPRVRVQIRG